MRPSLTSAAARDIARKMLALRMKATAKAQAELAAGFVDKGMIEFAKHMMDSAMLFQEAAREMEKANG